MKTISELPISFSEETKSLVLNTVRGKNFIMVYQPFVKKFGVLTGYYLSLLLDQYDYNEKRNQLKDGMFYFTHERASKTMNETEYLIKKAKQNLKNADFLYLTKKGLPAKEYIGINFNKIKELIQEKVVVGQDPLNVGGQGGVDLGGHYIKQNHNKPNHNKNIIQKEKTPLIDSDKKHYLSISKKLAKIISSHKKINCNQNINSWQKPIRLLMTKDLKINGTNLPKIKKRVLDALKFYEKHIGEDFIPVIHSGNSLREKFIKLEDAMKRNSNNSNNSNNYQNNKQNNNNKPAGNRMDQATKDRIKARTIIQDY